MTTRPFDMLNSVIGKQVMLKLKGNTTISGVLKSFDVHLNVILENAEVTSDDTKTKHPAIFVRGDTIVFISG